MNSSNDGGILIATPSSSSWLVAAQDAGLLLYVVNPYRTMFRTVAEVPDYVERAVPFFLLTIGIEIAVTRVLRRPSLRVNDSIGSLSAGMLSELAGALLFRGIQTAIYIWCYEHFQLIEMDPFSVWTWIFGLLAIDFSYYWFHRMAHEINLFWSSHVVHHSSEEYNLTTALRQSATQNLTAWMFYIPFAVALPPPIFAVHKHFNLLYQFWIHTETIGKLGVLEYVLNTPSHHRVHHGRNPYCIDKNYAGVLIIWDRMFGTFEAESEPVVYGLTHNIDSFDPLYIQFHHVWHILKTMYHTRGLWNKISVMIKGPGWAPGKPRLGLAKDIPYVERPSKVYNPLLSSSMEIYLMIQYVSALLTYVFVIGTYGKIPFVTTYSLAFLILLSLTSFGAICDRRSFSLYAELARTVSFGLLAFAMANGTLSLDDFLPPPYAKTAMLLLPFVVGLFAVSVTFTLFSLLGERKSSGKSDVYRYRDNEQYDAEKKKNKNKKATTANGKPAAGQAVQQKDANSSPSRRPNHRNHTTTPKNK